jgi:long-subunit acyl-CoA synthetase (AMP-forming)
VRPATIAEALRITAETHPDRVAVRTREDSVSLTWAEVDQRVGEVAAGLAELGVGAGDTVALMLSNRPEFMVADLAVMSLGAAPFSIYATSPPDQIAHVAGDAGARVAIVEEAFAQQFAAARLPALERVVMVEELDSLRRPGPPAWRVEPDDVATLIYTSGTTGPPKGVQLTHRNVMATVGSMEQVLGIHDHARVISWLPSAHIAERIAHHYLPVVHGMTVTCCPNAREVVGYLPAVRPTWFFAVPRVWEKLKGGVEAYLTSGEHADRNREWIAASARAVEYGQAGEPVPGDLAAEVAEADRELFSGVRAMLGLDRVVAAHTGAAPTPRDVLVFFHAIGVPLAELWGMSETCGVGCCNPVDRIKLGTVGPAAPGVELRLGDDSELLVRSAAVMAGYRGAPEQTAEAIDADGWLHTGDIATIDADGYVRIVDRKKELIINSAGKNMSPANIESTLKGASPLIGHACVIGDRRAYNTALIVLDADFAPAFAGQHGINGAGLAELARDARMREAVEQAVYTANDKLARVEQIKRFTLIEGDWDPGGDELTPTLKLRRRPIAAKYASEIEAMYAPLS